MLDSIRRQLPAIFTILGLLSLAVSAGLYLIYNEANRWVLTAGAIGLIFIVYAILERPEVVRESVTGRELRYGANSLVMTVAFVGIVALVNFLGARHTYRWDLTETKDFSLSPQTIKVLEQISTPVKVTAFYQQGQSGQEELQDLLKEYQRYSDKISYEFVDPVIKPGVARDYKVESYGTTVLETEGRRQNVATASEGDITSALVKLERGQPKKVGWVTGHGELDTEGVDRAGASEA
ncbi:MAG TPA: Gldg family protein, partial [Chloroflexota bacterium]